MHSSCVSVWRVHIGPHHTSCTVAVGPHTSCTVAVHFLQPTRFAALVLADRVFQVKVKKKNTFQLLRDLPFCNTLFEENKCIFVLSSSCPRTQC